ncbi:hypothetical protein [Chryseobacterium wangxinyae]|uniref:hypothetical protein n=1 Tax=unclassified Chryseobacterium TaxID=2593645 RepID=UPI00226E8277|nr:MULTISPECIES: hypothetical protein [unclassified Chryseobacterium]MCY0970085.1 hypothetical protein [Chryseobacterium sp. CY353]MCY0977221.1 hypothetical protein [Chryseobacterium sp. CY350]WBZ95758.1 hypothetical protein PGH12_01110 [Chryseobacterium sp. CY350]
MNLDQHITLTCENGQINKTDFVKVQDEINKKNFMDMEDFENLLKLGFPIDLELKKLKDVETVLEIRKIVNDKKVSARNFVAIIQSNVFNDWIKTKYSLK